MTPILESNMESQSQNQIASSNQPPIDLNLDPIPSQIPLPESDDESHSTSSSEIRNTVEVGKMLGFDMECDNEVLKDVMGEEGENQLI